MAPSAPKHEHFPTLGAMLQAAETGTRSVLYPRNASNDEAYAGSRSGPEAGDGRWATITDQARNGWEAQAQAVRDMLDLIPDQHRPEPYWDVTGGDLDVAAYLDGTPECWQVLEPGEAQRPVLNVLVSASYSWVTPPEAVTRLGLAVAGALESWRLRGYTLTVTAVIALEGAHGARAIGTIELADTRFAYDPTKVLFGVAHPGMLRGLWFGVQDGWPFQERKNFDIPGGRGRPLQLTTGPLWVRDCLTSLYSDRQGEVSIMFDAPLPGQYRWTQAEWTAHVEGAIAAQVPHVEPAPR